MVFFTCNACGESLKKAQVDKHVNMCRGCQVLSCIDCGKDFWGEDYKNHVRCISEDQKYGGKGYEAKSNKGDVKQQQWIQKIHDAMNQPGISPKLKEVLSQVSSYDNVPRKKAKFQNWMKNSLKIHNTGLHDQVWDIFSAATSNEPPKQPKDPQQGVASAEDKANGDHRQNGSSQEPAPEKEKKKKLNKQERKEARQKKSGKVKKAPENGATEARRQEEEGEVREQNGKKKKEKKKRKRDDQGEEQNHHGDENEGTVKKRKRSQESSEAGAHITEVAAEEQTAEETRGSSKGKFNWKGTIKAVLRQSPEEGLSVKKLRKKVLAAYHSFSGESNFKTEEELFALFNKKVNGNPKFKVIKDKVRLVK